MAKKLKLPVNKTIETIKKHNEYVSKGKDLDLNKPMTPEMIPLEKGPFYGIAQWPAVHHTMGGLRINEKAQVIDISGEAIPRLYAAGEATGVVHGANRLGGNAIPDAIYFGRVAGTNCAKS